MPGVNEDLIKVGPNTAATLLMLWLQDDIKLTLVELRLLVKKLSELMDEIEEARAAGQEPLFRSRWYGPADPKDE